MCKTHSGARGARLRPSWRPACSVVLVGLVLGGCSSAAVKTRSPVKFDVSAYRTYEWGTPAPVVIADEERERDAAVLEWTIRNAVDQTLAAKGYRRADNTAPPDFLVDFGVRLEEKSTDTFGEYITYRDLGGKQALGPAFVFGYEEGTLRIEVTDAHSHATLWSGSARTVLDDGQDVNKLDAAVGKILADFPTHGAAARKAASDLGAIRPPEP